MSSIGSITPPLGANLVIGPDQARWINNGAQPWLSGRPAGLAFIVLSPVTVTGAYFNVAAASGNMDIGIYDNADNRLGSTGGFAVPAAGDRSRALTASVSLVPGQKYWQVTVCDNGTAQFPAYYSTVPPLLGMGYGWAFLGSGPSYPLPATLPILGTTNPGFTTHWPMVFA